MRTKDAINLLTDGQRAHLETTKELHRRAVEINRRDIATSYKAFINGYLAALVDSGAISQASRNTLFLYYTRA